MAIINFGSINIDHVYQVEHFVQPGETLASTHYQTLLGGKGANQSIALAQAANESGWGTSRFATEYNALFGEYTYDFSNGVVPLLREEGETHLVKSFDSFNKSVQSYFNNLNSHRAYKDFRDVRKIMRNNNNFDDVKLLVNELDTYAADEKYIYTINSIIEDNKLDQLDIFTYSLNKS